MSFLLFLTHKRIVWRGSTCLSVRCHIPQSWLALLISSGKYLSAITQPLVHINPLVWWIPPSTEGRQHSRWVPPMWSPSVNQLAGAPPSDPELRPAEAPHTPAPPLFLPHSVPMSWSPFVITRAKNLVSRIKSVTTRAGEAWNRQEQPAAPATRPPSPRRQVIDILRTLLAPLYSAMIHVSVPRPLRVCQCVRPDERCQEGV